MAITRRQSIHGLGALAAAVSSPVWAQFRVEITGVGGTQIPVSIVRFRDEDKSPQPVGSIVRANLERSGQFKLIEGPAGLDEVSTPAWTEWKARAIDALAAGSVSRLADGRFDVRYKLWDTLKSADLGGQSVAVAQADLRLAAHRVSDAIYEKLTGDKGVFATRIAYVTKAGRNYTLRIADADGEGEGGQVALTSNDPIISPAWSPDGRELAYVSFESQKAVVWVQDVTTGKRQSVANFRGSNSAPAWSPDSRQLVVTLSRDGGSQLHVIGRDGGSPRRLTQSGAIDTEATFTADGKTLYFVSDRGGSPQVYRMPAAGGDAQRVTFGGNYNISPAVSPDGKTLAYISRVGGAFRVHTMDLASGTSQALSDTQDDESPSFAPNGKLIVYATRQQGRDVLMTTTLDGRIKTRLLSSGLDVREPVWGPFNR